MNVLLHKLGKSSGVIAGKLSKLPKKGAIVVVEFQDGMHEYVTTPVQRVMRLPEKNVYYVETTNSRYRLEVLDEVAAPSGAAPAPAASETNKNT